MSTPLTDAINALTTYSNTVTGASDTTLSDAVATLAAGYGGGGSGPSFLDLVARSLTTISSNDVITVGYSAFRNYSTLTSVDFPNCTSVGGAGFQECTGLTSVNLPNVQTLGGGSVFYNDNKLVQIRLPSLNSALTGGDHFRSCSKVKVLDIGSVTNIPYESTFQSMTVLEALILRKSDSITTLGRGNWTANGFPTLYNGTCLIYVPQSLLATYKTANNWKNLPNASTQFVQLEGSPYASPDFVYSS